MNRRLARYLASEIALCTGFTLLMLVGLFAFFDLLNEIDDIGKGGYRFIDALIYLTFTLPGTAYELLPVSVLSGKRSALASGRPVSSLKPRGCGEVKRMRSMPSTALMRSSSCTNGEMPPVCW